MRPDRGSVTAEVAVAMPSVVLLLGAVLCVGQLVTAQVQCADAARAAARLAARGESRARVLAAATTAGPPGARVQVGRQGAVSTVRVQAVLRLPLPGGPTLDVGSQASADVEPAAASMPDGPP